MLDYKKTLELAKNWAIEVGKIQLSYFRSHRIKVDNKEKIWDLVSEVDKKSEDFLVNMIRKNFPEHNILSEESGTVASQGSQYQWVIDPIDGTNNFVAGLAIFSISIALKKNNETIFGLVYAPYLKEMYTGIKGQGAFLGEKNFRYLKKLFRLYDISYWISI